MQGPLCDSGEFCGSPLLNPHMQHQLTGIDAQSSERLHNPQSLMRGSHLSLQLMTNRATTIAMHLSQARHHSMTDMTAARRPPPPPNTYLVLATVAGYFSCSWNESSSSRQRRRQLHCDCLAPSILRCTKSPNTTFDSTR